VLTPTPDIFTLLLMALPMIVLYEICIWLAWLDRRKNRKAEEEEAREREERLLLAPAAEATEAEPAVDPWHDYEAAADESGDDGWTDENPQQEFHDDPELPEIPENEPSDSPPDLGEDGAAKRNDTDP
jgi:hypothetical protein